MKPNIPERFSKLIDIVNDPFKPLAINTDSPIPIVTIDAKDFASLGKIKVSNVETHWGLAPGIRGDYYQLQVKYTYPVKKQFNLVFESGKHLEFLQAVAKFGWITVATSFDCSLDETLTFQVEQNNLNKYLSFTKGVR